MIDKFDVRFSKIEKGNDEVKEQMIELKKQIDELKKNTKETDRNMAKFLPLQMTSLVFEVIKNNFQPEQRPDLK